MRRDEVWNTINGQYIKTTKPTGYDVLINGTDRYLNFNAISGNSGYGFRDNGGTMEFKNSGGSWTAIGSGGGGGGSVSVNGAEVTNPNFIDSVTTKISVTGSDIEIQAIGIKASTSGGALIEASNGTDIGLLGAGNTANVEWYGNHNFNTATQDTIAAFVGAGKTLSSLDTTTYPSLTELTYVKGVTSAIQTQLDAKQATGNYITALTGDVTATGPNSVAATIANNAVTYAKMQDVSATAHLLGRVTAGAGDVEEIVIDADITSVSGSDDTIPSAKAVKTYVDAQFKAIFSANYAADVAAAGVSRFLALTSAVLPDSGTENQREFPLPVAGTAKNFFFTTTTAQSGTGSLVLTIRKNGADTSIVITIAAGSAAGQFSDTTNTESFAAGDTLSVKVTNNASISSAAYNGASLAFF